MGFEDIDLKLLKVLHVLLAERSVTRAGEMLGRSQPAISNALRRLRLLLGDELLVRGPKGLTLTPRAEAIQPKLRDAMELVEDFISDSGAFDPARAAGLFRISAPDRLTLAIVPALVERLQRSAPRTKLHVVTADREHALELLEHDVVDVAIGSFATLPHYFASEPMLEEGFQCLMRKTHPILEARLDMPAVLTYPHVVVSTAGQNSLLDDLLDQHKLSRDVLVRVTNFNAVPHLLKCSDMIGIFTRLASNSLAASFDLCTRPLPVDIGRIHTVLTWHVRNGRDTKHDWLRRQLRLLCQELHAEEVAATPGAAG